VEKYQRSIVLYTTLKRSESVIVNSGKEGRIRLQAASCSAALNLSWWPKGDNNCKKKKKL